jgi:hypothetical protein
MLELSGAPRTHLNKSRPKDAPFRVVYPFVGALWLIGAQADTLSNVHMAHAWLPEVNVTAGYDNGIGSSDSASQGTIASQQLQEQPLLRPADVLTNIPGMVVTQHSGDGKANQYFLRGINLDHGTDFATTVNGVPVNMPSHAHGQGYSDLNFLIPELVQRIDYRKGPYFAQDGDFSSAGSAHIVYRRRLERAFSDLTIGQGAYVRGVAASSHNVGEGLSLLTAAERLNHNGPWTTPQGLRKTNALLTLSEGSAAQGWSTSLSAYRAHWSATDQVPQRLIDAGTYQGQAFGRFDSLDPSDGANTSRTSLSGEWHQRNAHDSTHISGYVMAYDLDLYSNFTYTLTPMGDQFNQRDHRQVLGGSASHSWAVDSSVATAMHNTLGLQLRQDQIQAGLTNTTQRQPTQAVRDDRIQQGMLGLYGENEARWTDGFKTVTGLRWDQYTAHVQSLLLADNSGAHQSQVFSPKFSAIFGPWHDTEWFFNIGRGFHSNDARGTTAKLDPKTLQAVDAVPGLVRSWGREIGLKTQAHPNWQTSLALWQLHFDSELLYVGDAGNTKASRPSQRTGVEWSSRWTPRDNMVFDMNIAWTRPRYSDPSGNGNFIPNAVQRVANISATLRQHGPWSAHVGLRYIGPAALTEDNSVRAAAHISSQLRITRQMDPQLRIAMDVMNLTNRVNQDIQYAYTSRLAGEPLAGVNGLHVHPAEPRTVRLTAHYTY